MADETTTQATTTEPTPNDAVSSKRWQARYEKAGVPLEADASAVHSGFCPKKPSTLRC